MNCLCVSVLVLLLYSSSNCFAFALVIHLFFFLSCLMGTGFDIVFTSSIGSCLSPHFFGLTLCLNSVSTSFWIQCTVSYLHSLVSTTCVWSFGKSNTVYDTSFLL
jgi:hypothetical protein